MVRIEIIVTIEIISPQQQVNYTIIFSFLFFLFCAKKDKYTNLIGLRLVDIHNLVIVIWRTWSWVDRSKKRFWRIWLMLCWQSPNGPSNHCRDDMPRTPKIVFGTIFNGSLGWRGYLVFTRTLIPWRNWCGEFFLYSLNCTSHLK